MKTTTITVTRWTDDKDCHIRWTVQYEGLRNSPTGKVHGGYKTIEVDEGDEIGFIFRLIDTFRSVGQKPRQKDQK